MAAVSSNNRGSCGPMQGSQQANAMRKDNTMNEQPRHTARPPAPSSSGGSSTVDPKAKGDATSGSVNSK